MILGKFSTKNLINFIFIPFILNISRYINSTRQLYWADALEDRIERSDFDGHDRKQIVEHTAHPFSIALYETSLFWSNWYNKSVSKVPKRGQHNKPIEVRSGLGGALDIRAVSLNRQPYQWSPCMVNNGDCSHLCLFRYTSYICECPDKADTRSCQTGTLIMEYFGKKTQ